jgi:hypothetical protein
MGPRDEVMKPEYENNSKFARKFSFLYIFIYII